ncbi:hypothetical protein QJS10_CPA09g00503 [Acorus calamus]|uniref:Uncharacterized protein n=1 Tax=Acorus calamus TaxID=4465 RepID=A0AAV9E794_ACOCL|nr:hypothetical protein QJS10_CPA09g00503 [Acorus calamus]
MNFKVNLPLPEVNVESKTWASLLSSSCTKGPLTSMDFFPPESNCSGCLGFYPCGICMGQKPSLHPFFTFYQEPLETKGLKLANIVRFLGIYEEDLCCKKSRISHTTSNGASVLPSPTEAAKSPVEVPIVKLEVGSN